MLKQYVILAINLIVVAVPMNAAEPERPFIGIGHRVNEKPPGLKITQVVRHSPAQITGLEVGDIITEIDGVEIINAESLTDFLDKKNPGDLLKVKILRCEKERTVYLVLGKRADYQGSMKEGGRENFPDSAESIMADWSEDSVSSLVMETIAKAELTEQYEKLANAFREEFNEYLGHYTLDAVALPLLEPAATFASGELVKDQLGIGRGDPVNIWAGIPEVLDLPDIETPFKPDASSVEGIIEAVRVANAYIDSAFAGLSEDELFVIADIAPFMLNTFARTIYIGEDPDEELVESYYELVAATKKLDYSYLIKAGQVLSGLYERSELEQLANIEPGKGADEKRDILIDKMVEIGVKSDGNKEVPVMARLIVTGKESMTYSEQAGIWIDLGGDDTYFGFCGGTPYTVFDNYRHRFATGRVGLHIDIGGDDTYTRNTPGAIGSGFCGAGCLIDLGGDDRYSGDKLCIASAFCGTGLLIDYSGSDSYTSQECGQGFAVFGAGLLYDTFGDDFYCGARYIQGVGITKGLGILIDNDGNDRYMASFKVPNNYGNEDTWDGWSQGVGMGFRMVSAGGIGILCDRNGNDRYEAGNFSQGCGYFFGFGIFEERAGNDIVIGNRYTQGSGAHQAAALFRDRAGNDVYIGNEATNQAGTWDITTAYFIDDNGDDSYTGASLSQGGCAQNGFAVFIDMDGEDKYVSGGTSNGSGGGNDYHPDYDAKSLGVFIDLGNDKDEYDTAGKRRNNRLYITDDDKNKETGDGVFMDK
ncbi:hypothetical protein DRQ36_09225 [bacterium]|nr:MAG: hypothetical protein DRQ36_09225 [bacterium]